MPKKSAENDERYTTPATISIVKNFAGVKEFDLDAAACEESHHAPLYYSAGNSGLVKPWFHGAIKSVFCNPPWSNIEPWVEKAWDEIGQSRGVATIVMLLPADRCQQLWWQKHIEPFRDGHLAPEVAFILRGSLFTHFLPRRTRYGSPGDPLGLNAGSPPFGSVVLIWRAG